jgi:ATP-dependent helicase/nuclease subunit A
MTVHGAKGLEAPIVILADAASKPMGSQLRMSVHMPMTPAGPMFVHANKSEDHVPPTMGFKDAYEAAQKAEYWRKLYVGMTRAEDELYVTGTLTKKGKDNDTWYKAIADALAPHAEVHLDADDDIGTLIFPAERPAPKRAGRDAAAPNTEDALALPAALPPRPRIETVRPSSAAEPAPAERALDTAAERVVDAELARRKGIALHALLQHLTRIPPAERDPVAERALAALLPEYPAEHAELAAKAVRILHNPEFAELFGPDARAEVPFLATAHRHGTEIRLAGRIDRLVVTPQRVRIVDFKSDAIEKPGLSNVRPAYWTQLGLYALLARELFPGHAIEAAILWTAPESLMILPAGPLLAAVEGFTLA